MEEVSCDPEPDDETLGGIRESVGAMEGEWSDDCRLCGIKYYSTPYMDVHTHCKPCKCGKFLGYIPFRYKGASPACECSLLFSEKEKYELCEQMQDFMQTISRVSYGLVSGVSMVDRIMFVFLRKYLELHPSLIPALKDVCTVHCISVMKWIDTNSKISAGVKEHMKQPYNDMLALFTTIPVKPAKR
jgi:hypothetical protein